MNLAKMLSSAARALIHGRRNSTVELFTPDRVLGWIAAPNNGRKPGLLALHVDGRHAMNIAADRPRPDVLEAGLGGLHCGFDASLPRSLRDGRAHLVELRIGVNGPVMRGGKLRIKAGSALIGSNSAAAMPGAFAATPESPAPLPMQGVAYVDHRRAAIAGWATGCGAVSLRLADGAAVTVLLDREVPGLGRGSQQGFLYPLPPGLMDGAWHMAEVCFAPGGARLDGSPLRFRMTALHPLVEIVSLIGRELRLRVRDAQGAPADLPVGVVVDGIPLDLRAEAGLLGATLPGATLPDATLPDAAPPDAAPPDAAREMVLLDTGSQPPAVLARYAVTAAGLVERPAFVPALPPKALGAAHHAKATRAFSAFCKAPDRRFDPLWYASSHLGGGADGPAQAMGHYQSIGAAAGLSPGPFFDEAAARALHPRLAAAIGAGQLPCAFALELVLGAGALGSLLAERRPDDPASTALALALAGVPLLRRGTDPATVLRRALEGAGVVPEARGFAAKPAQKPPENQPETHIGLIAARLPAATASLSAADSIYAAWLGRLAIPAATRAAIDADEARLRHMITASPLHRAPLISIIMPSYNRAYTIGEAIQSVLEQSYPNWELLVCDDASDDKTPEVLRGFTDPRIRYMQFTKSNGAATRNKGLRFARGDYIAYLDSDNIWHPLFLDLMLRQLLAAPGSAIAYCAYLDTEIIGARVELHKISRTPFRPVQLSSRNFMDLNTILHHRRVYDWMGGFDESLPRLQDWDLMLRFTSVFRPLFVDHCAVFYRRNVAWGQVTHLFHNSGAQNTVNDKTNRRLTLAHERLQIDWPSRGRVTVILGAGARRKGAAKTAGEGGAVNRVLAESLARLAAGVAEVDLLDLTGTTAPVPQTDAAGLHRHSAPADLRHDPARLGHAFSHLLHNRPVLSVGLGTAALKAIPGLRPDRTCRLVMTAQGLVLRMVADPAIRFHLGTLPLPGGKPVGPPPVGPVGPDGQPPCVLLLPGKAAGDDSATDLAARARTQRLALLIPPQALAAALNPGLDPEVWHLVTEGRVQPVDPAQQSLPDLLARCCLAASLRPLAEVSALQFCLLNTLQARGIPLAVMPEPTTAARTQAGSLATAFAAGGDARSGGLPDELPDGLAAQWIAARAAYEIRVANPQWLFEKLGKLLADPQSYAAIGERGMRVQQIDLHPELVQERLAHLLYRLLFDGPVREVSHDSP